MLRVRRVRAADDDDVAGQAHADVHIEQPALSVALMGLLDHDMAAGDSGAELLQTAGELTDAVLEHAGREHVPEGDLDGKAHKGRSPGDVRYLRALNVTPAGA